MSISYKEITLEEKRPLLSSPTVQRKAENAKDIRAVGRYFIFYLSLYLRRKGGGHNI